MSDITPMKWMPGSKSLEVINLSPKEVLEEVHKRNTNLIIQLSDIHNRCMKEIRDAEISGDCSRVFFAEQIIQLAKFEEGK